MKIVSGIGRRNGKFSFDSIENKAGRLVITKIQRALYK